MIVSPKDMLQPFRFRINRSAFKEQAVEVIDFPWIDKLDKFYDALRVELHRDLKPSERAPWRTLNSALNLSAYLIQPFEMNYPKRQAIAPEGVNLPQANQLAAISRHFLSYYTRNVFPELRESRPRLFNELLSGLTFDEIWRDREALSLIKPGEIDSLAYNAIPSVVASSIIDRPITYRGERLVWRAAQQNKKLSLVSKPILASLIIDGKEETGYFVIRVEFALRTMPREKDPFIDMSIHCRRYIESPGSWSRRNSGTALIETVNPLITGWPQKSLVQVPLQFSKIQKENPDSAYYKYGIDKFLEEFRASSLTPIPQILRDPVSYWNIEMVPKDAYYLVYHEGMYPNHPIETGWPIGDQHDFYFQLCANLDGILQPVEPIHRSLRMFRKTRPTASQHIGDIKDHKKMDQINEAGETDTVRVEENLQESIGQAIKQVWLKKQAKPCVVVLWSTPLTRDSVIEAIREVVGEHMPVYEKEIREDLARELVRDEEFDTSRITPDLPDGTQDKKHYGKMKEQFKDLVAENRRQRIPQWTAFLRTIRKEFGQEADPRNPPEIMAIIEQKKVSDRWADEMRSPKSAIREACFQAGFLSQFLFTVENPEKDKGKKKGMKGAEESSGKKKSADKSDYYRILSAVYDLLLRQTGITIGTWESFFERLDLPEFVENMELIGLYRARSQSHNFDIPIAVRFTPATRHAEMTFPGLRATIFPVLGRLPTAIDWLPYPQACVELGKLVIKNKGSILTRQKKGKVYSDVCLDQGKILDFIDRIIRGPGKEKIVLIDAIQFRNKMWEELKNGKMLRDQYRSPSYGLMTPVELPGVRLIRILTGESPQYTSVDDPKEPDNNLYIAGEQGGLPIFYSIGSLSTVRRQVAKETKSVAEERHPDDLSPNYITKADWPKVAFKHSQMVEIIPFFLQPGDDPELFTWVAHRLRTTVNWIAGNTIYPRPIHLAEAFVEDVKGLFDTNNELEEEG